MTDAVSMERSAAGHMPMRAEPHDNARSIKAAPVIGIAGRKGHGKDTVARHLVDKGYEVVRFAGPLKAMLAAFYREHGLNDAQIYWRLEGGLKEVPCELLAGKTPRHAMQTLGTEWGRDLIGNNLWTDSLKIRVGLVEKAVVPDVRFGNECDAILSLGGRVIRVDASKRVPPNEHANHASENGIDHLKVDTEITNNGTLFELRHAVEAALAL